MDQEASLEHKIPDGPGGRHSNTTYQLDQEGVTITQLTRWTRRASLEHKVQDRLTRRASQKQNITWTRRRH